METKAMIGTILGIVAVILLVLSLTMPWWTMNEEKPRGYNEEGTYETTTRVSPEALPQYSSSEDETSNTTETTNMTSWMATIGTIATTISVVLIGMAVPAEKNNLKKIGVVLMIVGIIFALVAPIYMMTSFPDAIKDDQFTDSQQEVPDHDHPAKSFFGSYSEDGSDAEQDWGGGMGWFMSLIAGVLLIVSLILVVIGSSKPTGAQQGTYGEGRYEEPAPEQPPQQQQQQPYDEGYGQSPSEQPPQQEETWEDDEF